MMVLTLSSLLEPSCILLDIEADSKKSLFELMADKLAKTGATGDAKRLVADILAREELAPTGLGFGCAVPHAHSSSASRTALAFARLRNPLDFSGPDGDMASLVMLIVGSKDAAGLHLKLLSKIARFFHDEQFREAIRTARDGEVIISLFSERDR